VTLVFTDVEGSTKLLEELGTDAYRQALGDHRRVVRDTFTLREGYEVDYEGDAFFYAFASAQHAVSAVSEAMVGLEAGPIRIRVGVDTGEPALDPPKYVGMDVHQAARIMSAAHGGQVVNSPSTVALFESGTVELIDLGEHRFKDLSAPERVFQPGAASSRRSVASTERICQCRRRPFSGVRRSWRWWWGCWASRTCASCPWWVRAERHCASAVRPTRTLQQTRPDAYEPVAVTSLSRRRAAATYDRHRERVEAGYAPLRRWEHRCQAKPDSGLRPARRRGS
jgi:hypothetical protein